MGVNRDILLGGLLKLQLEVGLAEVKLCELVSISKGGKQIIGFG